jgi:hypothetical protein
MTTRTTARAQAPGSAPQRSLKEVLAKATRYRKSVRICLRGDLLGRIADLEEAFAVARDRDLMLLPEVPTAPAIARELSAAIDEARDAEVRFVFQSLGRERWRELVAAHPPTPQDEKKGADFDTVTLPIAAMAACCVEPEAATVESFEELAADPNITEDQYNRLWAGCHAANTSSARVPPTPR